MVVNYQIESTHLSSIIANLNSFATLPTTSKGAGEIIHYSGVNSIRWNSQTVDPTTNPIWSDLSAGGWDGNATSLLDMNGYSIEEVNVINANTLSSYNAGKVSLIHSLIPSIDNWTDLGSSALKFDTIYVNVITGISSNLAMSTNKITGLGAPTVNGDAIRYEHIVADEHTQYLLVSGSRTMAGALDMGNNSINAINTLNANTLSSYNAGKVSIVHSLVPSIDSWIDLGDATHAFDEVYVDKVKLGGSVKIEKNGSTGDMELQVASGDSIVFKAV